MTRSGGVGRSSRSFCEPGMPYDAGFTAPGGRHRSRLAGSSVMAYSWEIRDGWVDAWAFRRVALVGFAMHWFYPSTLKLVPKAVMNTRINAAWLTRCSKR